MPAADSKTYEYKAEMKQLLQLIVHSLYTHPEIFLRELISNSSDALNKVRYRLLTDKNIPDPDAELKITITVDKEAKTFSIEDNGIGMTEEDLIKNLGTIASSGTLEFFKKAQESGQKVENLIGQFGVGFYSVFMVTDQVTVETRHADKDAKACRWVSSGEGTFVIEESDKAGRGTRISFRLKDDFASFSDEHQVESVITKYSNFADFPIYLSRLSSSNVPPTDGIPSEAVTSVENPIRKINSVEALWRKPESGIKPEELNEFYKFISNDFEDPLAHLHLNVESGDVSFKALLFISRSGPVDWVRWQDWKTVNLYTNKILIKDDCKDLLPEYLRFLRGVVDTSDLPLNVSREMVQNSPALPKIRSILTRKILDWLKRLAEKDQDQYMVFYRNFGPVLKAGISTDFQNRPRLIELLRFYSTKTVEEQVVSLKEYVARMKPDQKEIYYLAGDNKRIVESNPKLEFFRKNDIEVLLTTEPADAFILPSLENFEDKPVKSITRSDIEVFKGEDLEPASDPLTRDLLDVFRKTLGDKIADVKISRRLVDSPATLVASKEAIDPQLEKILRFMSKEQSGALSKKVLEINPEHPLIKNMGRIFLANAVDPMVEKCITQIYESAALMDGDIQASPEFIKRLYEIMESATRS